MADIVALLTRSAERRIWVCVCGCTTHYHTESGDVFCGSCDMLADGAHGEWRTRLPETPTEPPVLDGANFKVVDITGADIFLRRQIKTQTERPAAFAVVGYDDGSVSTWSPEITTKPRRAWLKRKLAEAERRMTTRGADR